MNRYKTASARYWAGIIDSFVLFPVSLLGLYFGSPNRSVPVLLAWVILSYSSYWLYSVFFHASFGQTLGKRAMDVRVLDVSERRIPTVRQALMRDSGYILINIAASVHSCWLIPNSGYVLDRTHDSRPGSVIAWLAFGWFALEVVTMFMNRKRRALHDLIAGTVVVREA